MIMTILLQNSINFFPVKVFHDHEHKRPVHAHSPPSSKIAPFEHNRFQLRVFDERGNGLVVGAGKDGILVREDGWERERIRRRKKRVVKVRFFGSNNGGGGGGGDNSGTVRLLGNIALAIGLTYLSMTGQLGWVFDAVGYVFDAVVSLSLLAVLLPIFGLGALIWWTGRDILQDACPNCGNEFRVFKSTLNDELQLCPFCSQPFSVVGDEFVRDSRKFSKKSSSFGQAFSDFYPGSEKGKDSSSAVLDVEAEVKDAD
ncbi:hypothetical protein Tsubulata_003858 [Turnera subulata]|uniref:Uncharacterized protein n=1 Tax=Turnera subulata TaxID=218843 RepID=A0A9Q0G8Q6_9ROSI|nr:hypothetical protein Tsubulata_003858 [Turnera subulata]